MRLTQVCKNANKRGKTITGTWERAGRGFSVCMQTRFVIKKGALKKNIVNYHPLIIQCRQKAALPQWFGKKNQRCGRKKTDECIPLFLIHRFLAIHSRGRHEIFFPDNVPADGVRSGPPPFWTGVLLNFTLTNYPFLLF